jgi:glycosyltransferase involved in cell wall biosynthesis
MRRLDILRQRPKPHRVHHNPIMGNGHSLRPLVLDRLLNAFALTSHAKLVIAGTDDEGLVPKLSQMVDDLKIGGRVHFLPRTLLGADKEHLFAAAQVFILPSYSENFGTELCHLQ